MLRTPFLMQPMPGCRTSHRRGAAGSGLPYLGNHDPDVADLFSLAIKLKAKLVRCNGESAAVRIVLDRAIRNAPTFQNKDRQLNRRLLFGRKSCRLLTQPFAWNDHPDVRTGD